MKALLLILVAACMASHYVGEEIPIEEYVKGYLDGIGEKENIEEFEKCIGNIDPFIHKIKEAFDLLLKLDKEDMEKAIKILKGVYHEIHKKLEPCMDKSSILKKLMEAMKHADIMKILINILSHPAKFLSLINEFKEALKKEDFYKAGKVDGELCILMFMSTMQEEDEGIQGFVDFLEGFLEGIDQEQEYQNLKNCLGKFQPVYDDIIAIIEILKHIHWEHLEEVVEALIKMIDIVEEIFLAIKPCQGTPKDLEKIFDKLKNIDPDTFMQKVMMNLGTIISDLTSGINHLKEGENQEGGESFGDLFYVLFLKE